MRDVYEDWLNEQIKEYEGIKQISAEQRDRNRFEWAKGMLCAYKYSLEEYRRFRMNIEFDKKC